MIRAAVLLALAFFSPLLAGGWEPIPASVWAMKEDPARGIRGAVVLEDRLAFKGTYLEFTYRVRVLTEAGQPALELNPFSQDCYDFEGRTSYPDGRTVLFTKSKDFQTKAAVQSYAGEIKRTKVVPPGVNGNCVVEIRWRESADHDRESPLPPRWGYSGGVRFGNPFFTQLAVLEIPRVFRYAYQVIPTKSHEPIQETKSSVRIFTFRDLPALEPIPYALDTARDVPFALFYYQPERFFAFAKLGPEPYWKNAVDTYYKSYLDENVKKGKAFAALHGELSEGLPTDPVAKAFQLALKLDARIRNTSQPTFEEMAQRGKKLKKIEAQDLEGAVNQGEANSEGMGLLFLHLLKAQGIPAKVALVADRDIRLFSFKQLNAFQFTHQIYGVDAPGKGTAWFDPALRFATPGLIHPDFQGTFALQIDTKDWSVAAATLPAQPATTNVTKLDYALELLEEEDVFKLRESFTGVADLIQRQTYLALEPKEQNRLLKEAMERRLKGAVFTRTEVLNANTPKDNIAFLIEGRIEREVTRRRVVEPFPGMNYPLWVPDNLPETRAVPILIPYMRVELATSTFQIPKGYRLGKLEPFEKKNSCGTVRWIPSVVVKDGATEVKLVLRIDVTGFFLKPDAYEEFKTFLGWIRDVHGRTLILEKA